MQRLVGSSRGLLLPRPYFRLDLGPSARPPCAAAVVQAGVIGAGIGNKRDERLPEALVTALDYHVTPGQVLQQLRKSLSAIERRADPVRIGAGKLKENVRAHRQNR